MFRALPRVLNTALAARAVRSYADAPEAGKLVLTFLAPHKTFYAQQVVAQVNVPSTSGDFGILQDHVPALAVLKPGVVSVFEAADNKKDFFVSSGTITVNQDSSVQIVAEEACPVDHLDLAAARSGLEKYTAQASSAASDADKALAEVGVEVHTAMVRALEGHH
eukprot:m.11340 g.11340  ORF g.11340 m.11340 type:complete len:164 (-) comp6392_c0_seq1:31-522(-)